MQTVCVKLNLGSDGCKPASESPSSCAAMGQASRAQHSVIFAQPCRYRAPDNPFNYSTRDCRV